MRNIAIALIAGSTIGLAFSASAADMPAKAPLKAPPVVAAYNWTGFYVGGNVGGAWDAGWDSTATPVGPGAVSVFPVLAFSQSGSGFIGGGQIGYNWQFAPNWVAGIEADFQGSSLNGSSRIAPVPNTVGGFNANSFAAMSRDVDWFGTARARLGYAWDRWLVYATGGFAYGRVNYAGDVNFTGNGGQFSPISFSKTQTGWTAGAGVEWALPGKWTLKGEYLYVSLDGASALACFNIAACPATAATQFNWGDTDFHVGRVGVNYRFGP